jgi:non-specific serine/threonine protein kinase
MGSLAFSDLLRRHRLAAGLTQEALAERAGLSVHGIQKLERGVTRPYRDTVERLLAALLLSVDDQVELRTAAGGASRAPRFLSAAKVARHNLPVPETRLIGREQELGVVGRLLMDARLLTLTGVGGCGKTRLALEVARTVLSGYPDGVWIVELAPIADPMLVPHQVAKAVAVQDATNQTGTSALIRALQNRQMLLVLDNCEHLLDACARLVEDLMHYCAHLKVLATSREALGLTSEVAWRVPSLEVPDARQQLTLQELVINPAMQLFVERATALLPGFTLSERSASATAQICRRLDGIPLALELAAARIPALTPEQIATRLDQRFRLLTGGSRAALPRQQTLRATMDWSYDLLTESERALLNRLSVFAGGWSLEAAEAVCAGERIQHVDVLELLAQLVSKSLVVADEGGDGAKRYRLLETVRQYARERLQAAGEPAVMYQRHAMYFLEVGKHLEPQQVWPIGRIFPTVEVLDQLEREQDNMRTALRWVIDSQDGQHALEFVRLWLIHWFWRGSLAEGRAWLQETLELPFARGNEDIRQRALPLMAHMASRLAEYEVAQEAFEELLATQQTAGDQHEAAWTLVKIGDLHYLRAQYPQAWMCFDASRSEATNSGDKMLEGYWSNIASMAALCEGRYELARALATESKRAAHSINVPTAYQEVVLGNVDLQEGSCASANTRFLLGLEVALEYGDRMLLTHFLEGFSGLASALGQHERAANLKGVAETLRAAGGAPLHPAWRALAEPWLAISRQALGEAAYASALAAGRRLTLERAVEEVEKIGAAAIDNDRAGATRCSDTRSRPFSVAWLSFTAEPWNLRP